jgi:CDP-paratose 2-epimerase
MRSSTSPIPPDGDGPILVTGGAGFIGTNLVSELAAKGHRVRILDNLSRDGVEANADHLRQTYGPQIEWHVEDIRDSRAVRRATRGVSGVYHFAAQVAVTTSLDEPRDDFEINLLGTLNVLEALRHDAPAAPLLFTSTNKVYGDLAGADLIEHTSRYAPSDPTLKRGVPAGGLDFHSPYGCSKGAADQYVLDYARSYGLNSVVFRMSCIYGPHQCGNEDQGWVAHFVREALLDGGITIYGNGKQVRDILYVGDLIRAMRRATSAQQLPQTRGRAFNVGGGVQQTLSLLELCQLLEEITGRAMRVDFGEERIGDQRWYVSDLSPIERAIGWQPRVSCQAGLEKLVDWMRPRLEGCVAEAEAVETGAVAGAAEPIA